jgi:hypothetical protein
MCFLSVSESAVVSYLSECTKVFTFYMFTFRVVYIQYIQGICQLGLSTVNYALLIVVLATTVV